MAKKKKAKKVSPVPKGYGTLTPYFIVRDTNALVAFMKKAFGAKLLEKQVEKGRYSHAALQIGDSRVMMGASTGEWPDIPLSILVYVKNCDAIFARALKAGGTVIHPLMDQPYGDRSGGVKDPCGNSWWISTHQEDLTPKELAKRMKAARG